MSSLTRAENNNSIEINQVKSNLKNVRLELRERINRLEVYSKNNFTRKCYIGDKIYRTISGKC